MSSTLTTQDLVKVNRYEAAFDAGLCSDEVFEEIVGDIAACHGVTLDHLLKLAAMWVEVQSK